MAVALVNCQDASDVLATTVTDADGFYLFEDLLAGEHCVLVDLATVPAGACDFGTPVFTLWNGGSDDQDSDVDPATGMSLAVNVDAGQSDLTVDAGILCPGPASLGDRVWEDLNSNGIQDCDNTNNNGIVGDVGDTGAECDAGIADVMVDLVSCDDPADVLATTYTDDDGFYLFDNLVAGDYCVNVNLDTVPVDVCDYGTPVFTAQNNGSADKDSDVDSDTGLSGVIHLTLAQSDLTVDAGVTCEFGDCSECDGKVTQLTLQYNGSDSAFIEVAQKKGGDIVFSGDVAPGERFTFDGTDKKDTLGTEISIYVDGSLNTKIHTSCSKPVGLGMVFGAFKIVDGYSRNGGRLCPVDAGPGGPGDCSECDGKVTQLTLQYNGSNTAFIEVVQKKDGDIVFSETVDPGEQFTFNGTDKKDTLGTEISIYVDGSLDTKIHTSCSKPIGIGMISGSFEVSDGYSRNGGRFCPVDAGSDPDPGNGDCGECDGKVTQLTLQYNGSGSAYVEVVQKKGGEIFSSTVAPGEQFTFNGTDNDTLGTEISIYVDGSLDTQIHTSCSKPVGIGMISGAFEVVDGYSRNGGQFCPY
ncbi:MAG TPA: hypothetical protein EYP35_08100 [Desulfobacterales bacterium]|nr:hypothetical protein [Desulfobacterales bacterium]HIP39936.1 hypothetical protein [Desulfocapsa sulfexigens]